MTLPFENDTSAIIKKLTKRSLKTNKRRNFFIVMAIMLTTLLIGSVFSIGMSLLESVKMEQIRFAGTMAHAAVGHPTASQLKRLHTLDYVKAVGTGNSVGFVKNTVEMGKISLTLHYFDQTEWEKLRAPAYVDIQGNYPEKENEIMVSLSVLKRMGIDAPSIDMEIPLAYYTDSENKGGADSGNLPLVRMVYKLCVCSINRCCGCNFCFAGTITKIWKNCGKRRLCVAFVCG